MTACADIFRVGEQRPAGCTTVQVYLFFERHAMVLYDVEPIRDLHHLRRALTGGLSVKATTIPANDSDLGMAAQPFRTTLGVSILQNVDNGAPPEVKDDRPVGL